MASTKSLEEMLTTDVDESVVSALVGSLESQLSSSNMHAPSQEIAGSSVTTNHVNSAPVVADGIHRLHDGQKHGVAVSNLNTGIPVTNSNKTVTTCSQIVGVNSASPATSTNTVMVTLPGALPASGYINQVTGSTQQALLNTAVSVATGRTMNNAEFKIVYSPQTSVTHFNTTTNLPSVNNTVIQPQRPNVKLSTIPNGGSSNTVNVLRPAQATSVPSVIAGATVTSAQVSGPGMSAIHNLANVAAQQQPLIINASQPGTLTPQQTQINALNAKQMQARLAVRDQLDHKQVDKIGLKPQIVIKQEPNTSVATHDLTPTPVSAVTSSVATSVIQVSNSAPALISVSKPMQSQPVNVVTQVMSNPNLLPASVQIVNVNPGRPGAPGVQAQKTLAPRVVIGNPVRLATTPQVIAARPGAPVQRYRHLRPPEHDNTITLQPSMMRGTLFVKTENGQLQVVNVAPPLAPNSTAGSLPGTPTYRLQSVQNLGNQHLHQLPSRKNAMSIQQQTTQGKTHHIVNPIKTGSAPTQVVGTVLHQSQPGLNIVPTAANTTAVQPLSQTLGQQTVTVKVATTTSSVTQPLSVQTTVANSQTATTPSQMSPNTAKKKCKNFLSTLIRLASDQPEQVASNVKGLIQGLIDGTIQPEDFTNQLQKELNSSPQPCLVPFLKKSLPYLRHSLMTRELTIEGVQPPPPGAVTLPSTPAAIPNIQIAQTRPSVPHGTAQVRVMAPVAGSLAAQLAGPVGIQSVIAHQRLVTPRPSTTVVNQAGKSLLVAATKTTSAPGLTAALSPATVGALQSKVTTLSRSLASSGAVKEKEKRSYSSLRDDDDINDVAAMGGVNLLEESQRILASNAEIVGTQIRSCKDENFLFTIPLQKRISSIAAKHGVDDVPSDVVALISHATQERLKTLVEKLGVIAEHRLENVKNDSRYEITHDVKGQLKFLEELDRLEKKRHEEQERELLLRAAKSRSKLEDPEQLKLKQKAKEMQKAEMEEMRQREANMTALLAIGPRKKMKTDSNSIGQVGLGNTSGLSNSFTKPQMLPRKKRVNMKDMLFLMEQERETIRTPFLYKSYLK